VLKCVVEVFRGKAGKAWYSRKGLLAAVWAEFVIYCNAKLIEECRNRSNFRCRREATEFIQTPLRSRQQAENLVQYTFRTLIAERRSNVLV
jgi:hypothetical protein